MSYVITIERISSEAPLTRDDINAVLDSDEAITRREAGTAAWQSPGSDESVHLNIEESSLWTDSYPASQIDTVLPKLRELALALSAEVIGEEGEVLTSPEELPPPASPGVLSMAFGLIIMLVALPFMAIMFVVRVPYILWQVFRATR